VTCTGYYINQQEVSFFPPLRSFLLAASLIVCRMSSSINGTGVTNWY